MNHERVAEMLTLSGIWSGPARIGPRVRLRCGSIESDYVAAHLIDDGLLPTEPRGAEEIGLRVERAGVAAGNPHRDAIKAVYVDQVSVQILGARLVRDPAGVLDAAHAAVAKRLR